MNTNFGKRVTGSGNESNVNLEGFRERDNISLVRKIVDIIFFIGIIILAIVVVIITYLIDNPGTFTFPLLAWLSNPFQTTRKIKFPSNYRKGHSERIYTRAAKVLMFLAVVGTALGTLYVLATAP